MYKKIDFFTQNSYKLMHIYKNTIYNIQYTIYYVFRK